MNGIFIAFEGAEGSGKTTNSLLLYRYLKSKKYPVIYAREPGGTKIAEKIRKILLFSNEKIDKYTELFLYESARRELVQKKIIPALRENKIVICDRFTLSTLAYQGYGRKIPLKTIELLNKISTDGLKPDLIILFDIPTSQGLKKTKLNDRIARESLSFHRAVRYGYLQMVKKKGVKVIKADRPIKEVQQEVRKLAEEIITKRYAQK